jgi:hypothetical protein
MEVISRLNGLLTNAEVLEVLQEKRAAQQEAADKDGTASASASDSELRNRDLVELATIEHIEGTRKQSTVKEVAKFTQEMERLCQTPADQGGLASVKLTEAEMMQLCNAMPTTEIELLLLLSDGHVRCTETQVESIVACVCKCFKLTGE